MAGKRVTFRINGGIPDEEAFERFFGSADMAGADEVEIDIDTELDRLEGKEDSTDEVATEAEVDPAGSGEEGSGEEGAGDDAEGQADEAGSGSVEGEGVVALTAAKQSDYTTDQWRRATLIGPIAGDEASYEDISNWMLPVRNPDGTLSFNLLADAENALLNKKLKGVSVEQQRQAMEKIINMVRGAELNERGSLERRALANEGRYTGVPEEELAQKFSDDIDVGLTSPFALSKSERISKKLWKTLAMPYRKFKWMGVEQKFTKALAKKVVKNFRSGAVPNVAVNISTNDNEHSDDPERVRGRVVDLEVGADGLYAISELNPSVEQVLTDNPWMGASVYLHHNYRTQDDGKRWGPTLLHLCITPRQYLREAGGWQAMALSDSAPTQTIDASGVEYEPEEEGEAQVAGKDDKQGNQNEGGEQEVTTQQRQEETPAADEQHGTVKLSDFQRVEQELAAERAERRRGDIERRWERDYASKGVGPAAEGHILPLLLSTAADPDQSVEVFKLSDKGERTEETEQVKLADRLWKLADFIRDKKGVPLDSEGGTETVRGGDLDEDEATNEVRLTQANTIDEKATQYMKDNDIDDYGYAVRQVMAAEGVTR